MSQMDPRMIWIGLKGSEQWPKPKKEGPKEILMSADQVVIQLDLR